MRHRGTTTWAKAHNSLWGCMWEWWEEGTKESQQVTTGGGLDRSPRGMNPPALPALDRCAPTVCIMKNNT